MGRDALKVVLNFFLGARGRRCVSGNLMFAFCGASSTDSTGKAGNITIRNRREESESLDGGKCTPTVSDKQQPGEAIKIMSHAGVIAIVEKSFLGPRCP